jgi:hypothetical protein
MMNRLTRAQLERSATNQRTRSLNSEGPGVIIQGPQRDAHRAATLAPDLLFERTGD